MLKEDLKEHKNKIKKCSRLIIEIKKKPFRIDYLISLPDRDYRGEVEAVDNSVDYSYFRREIEDVLNKIQKLKKPKNVIDKEDDNKRIIELHFV